MSTIESSEALVGNAVQLEILAADSDRLAELRDISAKFGGGLILTAGAFEAITVLTDVAKEDIQEGVSVHEPSETAVINSLQESAEITHSAAVGFGALGIGLLLAAGIAAVKKRSVDAKHRKVRRLENETRQDELVKNSILKV